jgi:hypothetical protein
MRQDFDAEWERLQPHLPPQKPKTGRPIALLSMVFYGYLEPLLPGEICQNAMEKRLLFPVGSTVGKKPEFGQKF